jgi:hypothetical protein
MPYFRGQSTDYVFHYVGNRVRHEGQAASFWYLSLNSSIAVVPLNVRDSAFVFQDVTLDHQTVTCQGQFSFRFVDPSKAVKGLNLTINPNSRAYVANDLEMLSQRLTNVVRVAASSEIQSRTLGANIKNFQEMGVLVSERVNQDKLLAESGIELISLFVLGVQPTPEVAKALEADFREGLLRKADEAIYARRAATVDEERTIKEKELASQLLLEERKAELIARESENMIHQAEARGRALEKESAFKNAQLKAELELWNEVDPSLVASLGFRMMGMKGVNNLTITSEVMSALLGGKGTHADD